MCSWKSEDCKEAQMKISPLEEWEDCTSRNLCAWGSSAFPGILQNVIHCEDSIQSHLLREHTDRQMGFENRSDKRHKFLLKKSAIISATCLHMFSSMTVLTVADKLQHTDNSVASWGFQERVTFCKNSVTLRILLLIHTQWMQSRQVNLIIGQIITLWKNTSFHGFI